MTESSAGKVSSPSVANDRQKLLQQVCFESRIPVMDCSTTDGSRVRSDCIGFDRPDLQRVKTDSGSPPTEAHRFLVASITKPVVALAVLKLAAEGRLNLSDRIPDVLPQFRNSTYRRITLRHLLTHSSGLAETVESNIELRQQSADVRAFMQAAEKETLNFAAGTDCKYSSIGYMLLGAAVETVTGESLRDYLRDQLFEPIGMRSTSLGTTAGDETVFRNDLPVWQTDADLWDWNSDYWKQFAAAWGGLFSTAEDLIKLARVILCDGRSESGQQVLPKDVVRSMIVNQTAWLRRQPDFNGPAKDWSFGFRMQWPFHSASFGDFVSGHTVGHWGATGTLLWIDPANQTAACILTTIPFEKSRSAVQKASNILAVNQ